MNNDDEPQRRTDGLQPFVKGDPRINRTGRPKTFREFRRLAQQIAAERVLGPNGEMVTRGELLLRNWIKSKNPILQRSFVEYWVGKVPDKFETDSLENKTVLRLYYAHERAEVERAELERGNHEEETLTLQPPPDNGQPPESP